VTPSSSHRLLITVAVGANCVLFPKPYDDPTRSYLQYSGERFTLSPGERAGVRASPLPTAYGLADH